MLHRLAVQESRGSVADSANQARSRGHSEKDSRPTDFASLFGGVDPKSRLSPGRTTQRAFGSKPGSGCLKNSALKGARSSLIDRSGRAITLSRSAAGG